MLDSLVSQLYSPRALVAGVVGLFAVGQASAQVPRTSFWLGARTDVVGLSGPSGSSALYGGNLMIVRRFGASP